MRSSEQRGERKEQRSIVGAYQKALRSFGSALPVMLGVILLVGLFRIFVTDELLTSVFTGQVIRDTVSGALIGSVAAGNPLVSYIIGGELLTAGVSLFAVTAFIVAWVTVGLIHLPLEAALLGKRFALARNFLSFILSILLALATGATLRLIL